MTPWTPWWGAVEEFGQQTLYTCSVACARYLLHCLGAQYTEAELLERLMPQVDPVQVAEEGFSDDEIGCLLAGLGFRPRVRCLPDIVGHYSSPSLRVEEGNPEELWTWLCEMVARRQPVKVSLDLTRLSLHSEPSPPALHSVVVLDVHDGIIYYLDPQPTGQPLGCGAVRSVPQDRFQAGWQVLSYTALALERRH